jgi:hypothetical protein
MRLQLYGEYFRKVWNLCWLTLYENGKLLYTDNDNWWVVRIESHYIYVVYEDMFRLLYLTFCIFFLYGLLGSFFGLRSQFMDSLLRLHFSLLSQSFHAKYPVQLMKQC